MSLSSEAKYHLSVAMSNDKLAQEVAGAIDALHTAAPAAHVAVLGSTSNLSAAVVSATVIAASDLTAVDSAHPTKAEVDTGIDTLKSAVVSALDLKADNADLETLRTQAEARLDAIEAKIDAVINALVAAGLMS